MRLLDLFSGAGGAAMGYSQAGFTDIVGVDIKPQPQYPFHFVQADAFQYLAEHWQEFDVIHGSPVCTGYSVMNNLPWLKGRDYPMQILPLRIMLNAIGKPYVIENVMGARWGAKGLAKRGLEAHGMQAGWLCGQMFGLPFYRHRLFEANWLWLAPEHPKHQLNLHPRSERYVYGGTVKGLPGGAAGLDVKPCDPFHDATGKSILGPGNLGKGAGMPRQYVRQSGPNVGIGYQPSRCPPKGSGTGHAKGWRLAAKAMGIDWMKRAELTQAIPPVYTAWVGQQLMTVITVGRA